MPWGAEYGSLGKDGIGQTPGVPQLMREGGMKQRKKNYLGVIYARAQTYEGRSCPTFLAQSIDYPKDSGEGRTVAIYSLPSEYMNTILQNCLFEREWSHGLLGFSDASNQRRQQDHRNENNNSRDTTGLTTQSIYYIYVSCCTEK